MTCLYDKDATDLHCLCKPGFGPTNFRTSFAILSKNAMLSCKCPGHAV